MQMKTLFTVLALNLVFIFSSFAVGHTRCGEGKANSNRVDQVMQTLLYRNVIEPSVDLLCTHSGPGNLGSISMNLTNSAMGLEIEYAPNEQVISYLLSSESNGQRIYCNAVMKNNVLASRSQSDENQSECANIISAVNMNSKRLERIKKFSKGLSNLNAAVASDLKEKTARSNALIFKQVDALKALR